MTKAKKKAVKQAKKAPVARMHVENVPIDSIKPDPDNVRTHDAKNLRGVKGSLKRFGQQKPIVVDSKGIVLAGNGTLAAARELGWATIDVVRTTLKGKDAVAYAIADNRTSELATWDDDALNAALAALDTDGWDLPDLGFDEGDWTAPKSGTKGLKEKDGGGELSKDDFDDFAHRCPRCSFEWSDE